MPIDDQNEKKIVLKGHEVVVHTAPTPAGGFYAFAVLLDPFKDGKEMKSFEAQAKNETDAEVECARQALLFLEQAPLRSSPAASFKASRTTLEVLGHKVDIFCDLVGDAKYQAFPFQYRADGKRAVILRFHLDEAIVGASAEEAHDKCVRRLEEYFGEAAERTERAGGPPESP